MYDKFSQYAELLVKTGLNLQKGQRLIISCPVECAWFARLCAQAAYGAGCREVVMSWSDDALARLKYLHADSEVFDSFPEWQAAFYNNYAREGAAYLAVAASDPENLTGIEQDRITRAQRSSSAALQDFRRRQIRNDFQWCIGSVPIPSWAKKVFPGEKQEDAMEKLWDAILETVRIDGKNDAVEAWRKHVATLQSRVEKLNALDLESIRFTNSLGTDLLVRLPEDHVWAGGDSVSTNGIRFCPNMPSEEIFTAPLRDGVDGTVYSSKPLALDGNIVDRFSLTVQHGKITGVHAETGEETLKAALSVDEGASFFGEVALVPFDSPISRQNLLYYNTLYDENASCHLAFGEAYPECLKGGGEMSKEELRECGLNDSITHVDFMIGTEDTRIMGKTWDGQDVPVFENGNFVL
ncbi:MAG: aminopeptidase [Oscillospiraceae bacterium]|nr:aminopeptidase [Oscillospiraceae bacterium]